MRRILYLFLLVSSLYADSGRTEVWEVRVPPSAEKRFAVDADWRQYDRLELEVQRLDEDASPPLECSFFLETKQELWFQTRAHLVLNGERQVFEIRLDEGSPDLRCVNAKTAYSPDGLRWVRTYGIKIFSVGPARARVRVEKIRLIERKGSTPQVREVRWRPGAAPGKLAPVSFALSGFRGNPYSSSDVEAWLLARSGRIEEKVPFYYLQRFLRSPHPGTGESLVEAFQRPLWQANWIPARPGPHQLQLNVRFGNYQERMDLGTVQVGPSEAPEHKGGIPHEDAVLFRGDHGERLFEYREGHWLPAETAGLSNKHWDVRLDWTSNWGTYTGLGEFDQLMAWRFERVLDHYEEPSGLPVLVFSEDELDDQGRFNWKDHPLNDQNGGHLDRPAKVFSDIEATRIVADRTQYIWARYGHLAAVSGVLFRLSGEEQAIVDWMNRMARTLLSKHPHMRIFCSSPGLPERHRRRSLDLYRTWETDSRLSAGTLIGRDSTGREVTVESRSSDTAAIVTRATQHWTGESAFSCDVYTPVKPDGELKVACFVRTDVDTVYQSILQPLKSETWNRIVLQLNDPEKWVCLQDKNKTLNAYDLQSIREVGLRFFRRNARTVSARVRECALLSPYRFDIARRPGLAIVDLRDSPMEVSQYEKFELDFRVNRVFNNPYNPREIKVDLVLTDPSGKTLRHPAFFFEPWKLEMRNGRETPVPDGAPSWRARFSPWVKGRYTWRLIARSDEEQAEASGSFNCGPGRWPGFVRVAEEDPRYFEYTNGEFYYPIGHNLRSPGDSRAEKQGVSAFKNARWAADQGTRAYEAWFRKMQANEENFTRVWMCPWWGGLEWNAKYTGYHGLGYYNQANAARMDRVLELAEQSGISVNLETMNHGTLSTKVDENWSENPLNQATQPGGYLRYASDFFENERAQQGHQNMLRYAIARWGYSRAIAWWGIMTETEWIEGYYRSVRGRDAEYKVPYVSWVPRPYENHEYKHKVVNWLVKTGGYIRETDAHPHPVSTHFSMPEFGLEVWHRPNMDVVHNNTYTEWVKWWKIGQFAPSDGIADVMFVFARYYDPYARRKPLMVGEWGGSPYGSSASHLTAEIHLGTWVMTMTRCAGTAGFWWWNFLDANQLYGNYKAVAAFMKGEDRRGKNYTSQRASMLFPEAVGTGDYRQREGIVLFNSQELFGYVYPKAMNRQNYSAAPDGFNDTGFPKSGPGQLDLPPLLRNGQYILEYWNTFTGRILSSENVSITDTRRSLPVPSHRVDLALKLKKAADSSR